MSQFPPQGNEPGSKGFDTEISEWIWSILECGGEVKGGGRGVESGMAASSRGSSSSSSRGKGRVRPLPYLAEKGREGIIWPKSQPSEFLCLNKHMGPDDLSYKFRAVVTLGIGGEGGRGLKERLRRGFKAGRRIWIAGISAGLPPEMTFKGQLGILPALCMIAFRSL